MWLLLTNHYFKEKISSFYLLIAALLASGYFLVRGLVELGELRENYLAGDIPVVFIYARYICFAGLALLIWSSWITMKRSEDRKAGVKIFSTAFNIILLAVICNEFIHQANLAGYPGISKLGVSIISGLYAAVLIFTGIRIRQRHLRISGILLFGFTLVKIFFYDLASMSTVSKTLLLVILGVILLVVSFFYNKYREVLFANDDPADI
jgi:uncharacterized membrane protein